MPIFARSPVCWCSPETCNTAPPNEGQTVLGLSERHTMTLLQGTLVGLFLYHMLFCLPVRSMLMALRRLKADQVEKNGAQADTSHFVRRHVQKKRQESWNWVTRMLLHINGVALFWAVLNVWVANMIFMDQVTYIYKTCLIYLVVAICCSAFDDRAWWVGHARGLYEFVHRAIPGSVVANRPFTREDLGYASAMICITVYEHLTTPWQVSTVRVAITVMHRSTAQFVFWNCVYHGSFVIHKIQCDPHGLDGLVNPAYVNWWDMAFDMVLVTFMTFGAERLAYSEAHSAVSARAQGNERRALTSILNATCDAVVHLDDKLCVVGNPPRFAAMILRTKPNIDKADFMDLLASDSDREAFANIMKTAPDAGSDGERMARAFQLNLKDIDGNTMRVQGLHTIFTELDGGTGHLLGLSESGDPQEVRMFKQDATTEAEEREASLRRLELGAPSVESSSAANRIVGRDKKRNDRRRRRKEASGAPGSSTRLPLNLHQLRPPAATRIGKDSPTQSDSASTSSDGSSISSTQGLGQDLLQPERLPTVGLTQELSLFHSVMKWNFLLHPGDCCHYHGAIRTLKAATIRMDTNKCFTFQLDIQEADVQCKRCGIMGCHSTTNGDSCSLCEGLPVERWQSLTMRSVASDVGRQSLASRAEYSDVGLRRRLGRHSEIACFPLPIR